MKTFRLNKPIATITGNVVTLSKIKPFNSIRIAPSTPLDADLQAGKKVIIRRIPEDIKKAKKLFKVGSKYKIQEPPKTHLNTGMAVYLKAEDGKTYLVGFPYFMKVAN